MLESGYSHEEQQETRCGGAGDQEAWRGSNTMPWIARAGPKIAARKTVYAANLRRKITRTQKISLAFRLFSFVRFGSDSVAIG